MAKEITRTINVTRIIPAIVKFTQNGIEATELEAIVTYESVDETKALKMVHKVNPSAIIASMETTQKVYSMDIELFVDLATEVKEENKETAPDNGQAEYSEN